MTLHEQNCFTAFVEDKGKGDQLLHVLYVQIYGSSELPFFFFFENYFFYFTKLNIRVSNLNIQVSKNKRNTFEKNFLFLFFANLNIQVTNSHIQVNNWYIQVNKKILFIFVTGIFKLSKKFFLLT